MLEHNFAEVSILSSRTRVNKDLKRKKNESAGARKTSAHGHGSPRAKHLKQPGWKKADNPLNHETSAKHPSKRKMQAQAMKNSEANVVDICVAKLVLILRIKHNAIFVDKIV